MPSDDMFVRWANEFISGAALLNRACFAVNNLALLVTEASAHQADANHSTFCSVAALRALHRTQLILLFH